MTDPPNSESNQTLVAANGAPAATLSLATLRDQLRPVLLSVLSLTFLTGALFPLILFVLARPMFPTQAKGSLMTRDGVIIGSELIGQNFTSAAYFHPRPSAAGAGYDAASSSGTNLGPANPKLKDGAADDPKTADTDESFVGVRQLTEEYRKLNGLAPDVAVPIDAVTRSGSGLDPHISPANAGLQMARMSRARGVSMEVIRSLVSKHTKGRQLGFLGEPRVAVLSLNLELDRAAPLAKAASPQSATRSESR
jgi:potassium-transporting ATPase KdpC subunit